mgnify:CR=1 FL=1|jgi:hypothetical protein
MFSSNMLYTPVLRPAATLVSCFLAIGSWNFVSSFPRWTKVDRKMLGNVDMVFWPLKEKLAMRVLILSALLCVTHAFSAGNMASLAYSRGQLLTVSSSARAPPSVSIRMEAQDLGETIKKVATSAALGALLLVAPALPVQAENAQENFKVLRGASSTQDSGSRRTITRGTVLDNSNFAKQNLKGVSFQQSLCRSCDFKGAKLVGASFFDGDLSNANMEGADVSNVRPESLSP